MKKKRTRLTRKTGRATDLIDGQWEQISAAIPNSEECRIKRLELAKLAPQMPGTWDYLNGRDTRTPEDLVRAHADWAMKWADAMIAAAGQPSQAEVDARTIVTWLISADLFGDEAPAAMLALLGKYTPAPVPAAVPAAAAVSDVPTLACCGGEILFMPDSAGGGTVRRHRPGCSKANGS